MVMRKKSGTPDRQLSGAGHSVLHRAEAMELYVETIRQNVAHIRLLFLKLDTMIRNPLDVQINTDGSIELGNDVIAKPVPETKRD